MLFEAAMFIAAAIVHFSLIAGYRHQKAGTAEIVIGVALLVGLAITLREAKWRGARRAGASLCKRLHWLSLCAN
jgi:hypothetical protein